MDIIFFTITVIICLAAFLSLVFRSIKQPALLAYILTGIIISHFSIFPNQGRDVFQSFAELGITLLLFMLGMEIRVSEIPTIGKVAFIAGGGQIILTTLFGYGLGMLLGFSQITSVYIGFALTFSSTIMIVKLLSDKKDIHSLYGKIAIGISLLQDFVAIAALIFLPSFFSQSVHTNPADISFLLYKGMLVVIAVFIVGKYLLPKLLDYVAKSPETLFLFSLAWVFGLAAVVSSKYVGLTIEIGGFLAGLAMSSTTENFQIAAKLRPLRDFFIIIFFVFLGMQMNLSSISGIVYPAIIMSLMVMLYKPLVVMVSMGLMGYRRRTSLFSGLAVAQVSEFSLILLFAGSRAKQIDASTITLVTLVSIITFTFSTYAVTYNNKLYKFFHEYLFIFERKNKIDEIGEVGELSKHVVLVGAHRMGESILHALTDAEEKIVVVDFDPEVVSKLKKKNITSLFGDITDLDIQEKAQLHSAKLVISTVPDVEDNEVLIKYLNKLNRRAKIVVIATDRREAKLLYNAGADYVVLPHITSGKHVARLLKENHLENIDKIKEEDLLSFI